MLNWTCYPRKTTAVPRSIAQHVSSLLSPSFPCDPSTRPFNSHLIGSEHKHQTKLYVRLLSSIHNRIFLKHSQHHEFCILEKTKHIWPLVNNSKRELNHEFPFSIAPYAISNLWIALNLLNSFFFLFMDSSNLCYLIIHIYEYVYFYNLCLIFHRATLGFCFWDYSYTTWMSPPHPVS